MDCIFCKIANKLNQAEIVYEDEKILAFKDIKPQSPIHLLIIPKKHIPSVDHVETEDKMLMGELILAAKIIARERNLNSYKLQINVGRPAGQMVDHLHLHLLAKENKSSSSPTEALAEVKKRTKFSSPFVAARVSK